MSGFNWLDLVLLLLLMTGMAIGYSQGMVRQVLGLAALYIGLVLATQFFQPLSRAVGDLLNAPPNTLTNAMVFFAVLFIVFLIVNFLAMDAYKSTRIKLAPSIDHIAGITLGLVSMWIILTIAVTVLQFAAYTQGWGQSAEGFRIIIKNGLENSRIAEVTASTLPMIVSAVRPWLPGGLPAIFNL